MAEPKAEKIPLDVVVTETTIVVTFPRINPAKLSKTGKSKLVVSTGGFAPTTAVIEGQPMKLNASGIIALP